MALRRFQPISRSGQWSEIISWTDPRTREKNSLDGAVLTLGLYERPRNIWGGPRDYGWPLAGRCEQLIVSAQTNIANTGAFVILPDGARAQITLPAGTFAQTWGPEVDLVVWATVDGATDEITRETIPVLGGPRALPLPTV